MHYLYLIAIADIPPIALRQHLKVDLSLLFDPDFHGIDLDLEGVEGVLDIILNQNPILIVQVNGGSVIVGTQSTTITVLTTP